MDDSILLYHVEHDLNKFSKCWFKNSLSLNAEKCKCVSFSRQKNKSLFPYGLYDWWFSLKLLTYYTWFWCIMSSDLTFNVHIDVIYRKSFCVLGFIERSCSDLKNIIGLKVSILLFRQIDIIILISCLES